VLNKVQYFNYTYKRTGTLWEERAFATAGATVVDSESYLLKLMHYIDMNPECATPAPAWSRIRVRMRGRAFVGMRMATPD
jgi:hypothetical protein